MGIRSILNMIDRLNGPTSSKRKKKKNPKPKAIPKNRIPKNQ